jgi:hypothetical protein
MPSQNQQRSMRTFVAICFLALLFGCRTAGTRRALEVSDCNGVVRKPFDNGNKSASVLIFFWHDCPISNGFAPEINRLCDSYTNFSFYIVQVDPDLTASAAKKHAVEFGLRAPVLLDPTHQLVRAAGARVTPEAVAAKDGKVLYRGRIDDRFASLTQRRDEPTHRDLRDALDAIAEGKPVSTKSTQAIGCFIEHEK